jgi:hypothetical protein
MDDFENDLATALRSAVPAPPTEIDPSEITRRTRRGRSVRSVVAPMAAALVVAAILVTVLTLARAGGGRSNVSTSPPFAGELDAAQRARAVRVAQNEARMSMPPGSVSTANTPPNGEAGWPWNVERVEATVTTHAAAMPYVGASGGDAARVLVIRLVGHFSWVTTGPPGHGPATGNVITVVADPHTGQVVDSGLERQNPPRNLPDATVLYVR